MHYPIRGEKRALRGGIYTVEVSDWEGEGNVAGVRDEETLRDLYWESTQQRRKTDCRAGIK